MKIDRGLKILLIILLIIFISIISFSGLYKKSQKMMVNMLADYKLGMDLKGSRVITINKDSSSKTIYYDKDGNVVKEEVEGGSKKEVPVNSEENLTKENFVKTKEIISKRLSDLGIAEYLIRQDENTGRLTVQIPEDDMADLAVQYIYTTGKFEVVGENEEILLNNSNIKVAKVGYNTTENGTTVYLNIEFNKDCREKLKEISNTYVKSTDEEGNDTGKKITIRLDSNDLISTSFDEEITNATLSLSIGSASKDSTSLNSYIREATNLSILLNNENLPVSYVISQNRYVASDITSDDLKNIGVIAGVLLVVAVIVLAIMYKKNGILVGIANIGYIATLLILIRYTNVILTVEGLIGILISVALNYIFSCYVLKIIKDTENLEFNKTYNKAISTMLLVLIPAVVVGITLCFVNWMPIYSFGEIIFWGILTIFIYNTIFTRTLLINSIKKQ